MDSAGMSYSKDSTNLDRNDTQNMMGLHTHTQTHRGIKVSVARKCMHELIWLW